MSDAPLIQPAPTPSTEPLLVETPRGFALTWMLGGLIVAAMVADALLGGFGAHAISWVVIFVVVVGLDYLVGSTAQRLHSLVVTNMTISIGSDVLDRQRITGLSDSEDVCHRVLGRVLGQGMPRGKKQLRLRLSDDSDIIVPTSQPETLAKLIDAVPQVPSGIELVTHLGSIDDPASDPASDSADDVAEDGDDDGVENDEAASTEELWERACSLYAVSRLPLPTVDHSIPALVTFTADEDGERVGYAKLIELDSVPYLAEIAVLPSHMRRGFGTALMEQACQWVAQDGRESIVATAFVRVPWSVKFLQSCGFENEPDGTDSNQRPELAAFRQTNLKTATGRLREQIAMRHVSTGG